jgi:hypothetical protein
MEQVTKSSEPPRDYQIFIQEQTEIISEYDEAVEASQVLAELRHEGITIEFARPRADAPEPQLLKYCSMPPKPVYPFAGLEFLCSDLNPDFQP